MNRFLFRTFLVLLVGIFHSVKMKAVGNGTIEGTVTDAETFQPVPYAMVELLNKMDSSQVKVTNTNKKGQYNFTDVAYGKYILRISCIGYKKVIIPEFELSASHSVIKFVSTNLFIESEALNEVLVMSHRLTGIIEEDKIIYTMDKKSAEHLQSGIELLRQIPDITVDYISDNVKLAGNSNILFEVNGRKVDKNYLLQLNPELVEKVELISNPGAKYDSDVNAVINFILKKKEQCGLSGRIRLTIPNSSAVLLTKNNAGVDLFLNKVRFYAGVSYNQYRYRTLTSNLRTIYSLDTSMLMQQTETMSYGKSFGLNCGIDWFINDKNILNSYSSIKPKLPEKSDIFSDNVYTASQSIIHNTGKNYLLNNYFFYDYSFFFLHKFEQKNHEISFESYLSNKNTDKNNNYIEQLYNSDNMLSEQFSNNINQITSNENKQLLIKIDYHCPFTEKLKLNAGYNGYFLSSDYFYRNSATDFSDAVNYNENRHSAYVNISVNSEQTSILTGIRYEFSNTHLIHIQEDRNKYSYFLPSFMAQYKPGKKHSIRFSFRNFILRPGVQQLSPINYQEDSYLQISGNQYLRPGNTYRIELMHRIQISEAIFLSYRPYLNFIKGDIRLINLENSDSVLTRKYANVGNDNEYGLTFSGDINILKVWSINPSFTCFRQELEPLPEYGIIEKWYSTSCRFSISSQFELSKAWVFFVEYTYNAPATEYQTKLNRNYDFKAGFSTTISKKINLSIITINPWNAKYLNFEKSVYTRNTLQKTKEFIKYNYLILVRFGYKFNLGRIGKKLERSTETEEDNETKKGIFN